MTIMSETLAPTCPAADRLKDLEKHYNTALPDRPYAVIRWTTSPKTLGIRDVSLALSRTFLIPVKSLSFSEVVCTECPKSSAQLPAASRVWLGDCQPRAALDSLLRLAVPRFHLGNLPRAAVPI